MNVAVPALDINFGEILNSIELEKSYEHRRHQINHFKFNRPKFNENEIQINSY